MKRLEISKLMDEYQDDEFFPDGGTTVDTQAIKDLVMAQAAPAKKRRVPPLKAVLLAAALAVGCVLMIAAGLPTRVFHLVTGGIVTVEYDLNGNKVSQDFSRDHARDLVTLEDGRLWLTLNGERTDVTDLIDAETPYIVESTDPESGFPSCLIVGGTPEDFGWCYYQVSDEDGGTFGGGSGGCYTSYCTIDGEVFALQDLTDEQRERIDPNSHYDVWRPWYLNAKEQLHERGIIIH